jgi:dihydrofolate reductase
MRRLTSFTHVTLDGFFTDEHNDMSWAHTRTSDPEWSAFVAENAGSGGMLLFGRVTYQMMAGYWPTPQAKKDASEVADGMNKAPKVVFSRTLAKAEWSNTTLVKGDLATEVKKLKDASGPPMVILGSGSIVAQLAQARLIDEFQLAVNPLILGRGRTLFEGVKEKLSLTLAATRAFKNGTVLMRYHPAS